MSSGRPALTVVVPSVNGWPDLEPCLEALAAQRDDITLEVIVVDRVGASVRAPLRERYSGFRLLEASPETSIPSLRALAFREARADVVGVIEDHVIVPPDWARRMLTAHAEGAEVVGGTVENAARERLVDWAAFLCEYSHCLQPAAPGPAEWLTGNNVTYRRPLLERFSDLLDRECWENDLHQEMRRAGVTLHSKPDIRVRHLKHYTVGEYLQQRYFYSRSYAGMRVRTAGRPERLLFGLAAFALPPILLYRIVSRVWRTGRHRRQLLFSLPLIALFACAWAAGEVAGYWFGAGDSLRRVR